MVTFVCSRRSAGACSVGPSSSKTVYVLSLPLPLGPLILLTRLAHQPVNVNAMHSPVCSHLDVGSWVRAFPQLKHLELVSMHLTVRLPLSSLTGLTSLSLSLKDPDHFNMVRLYMDDHCLPGSLRHLYLDGFAALPAAVTKVRGCVRLAPRAVPYFFLLAARPLGMWLGSCSLALVFASKQAWPVTAVPACGNHRLPMKWRAMGTQHSHHAEQKGSGNCA